MGSPPQKSSCKHVGKAPYLGAWESQRHLKRSLVLYQLHPYCPAADQLCSQEEIGSNVKGSQSQVWKAKVQHPFLARLFSPLKPVLRLP